MKSNSYGNALHHNSKFSDFQSAYRSAEWLESEFSENIWNCKFDKKSLTINFEVTLYNHTKLTDKINLKLLDAIKCFLCAQSSNHAEKYFFVRGNTHRIRVLTTLTIIDYILLNGRQFDIANHGFGLISANDLKAIVIKRCESSFAANSLYEWPSRLSARLKSMIAGITPMEVEELIKLHPFIGMEIPPKEDRKTDLTDEEIVQARCALWLGGYYKRTMKEYVYAANINILMQDYYLNILNSGSKKIRANELNLIAKDWRLKEFDSVPVRNDDEDSSPSEKPIDKFISCLTRITLLNNIGIPAPVLTVGSITARTLADLITPKHDSTYTIPPFPVVIGALRHAIIFVMRYGHAIVESYLNVLHQSLSHNENCYVYARKNSIQRFISPELKQLNVKEWTGVREHVNGKVILKFLPKEQAFTRLRNSPGLHEIVLVLYGAITVIIGTLSARRAGEIFDLRVGSSTDISYGFLVFENRKTGHEDIRTVEARPIPHIVAECIRLLEKLHNGNPISRRTKGGARLMSSPSFNGKAITTIVNQQDLHDKIDIFCDYFQIEVDELGRRYYLRNHQLREFFATVFFWKDRSPLALDTLRWYLGHEDIEHLFHYIKETVSGEILIKIKAELGVHITKHEDIESTRLLDLVELHFGTRNVTVLQDDELTEYITHLLKKGDVSIEPVFFINNGVTDYSIAIKVGESKNG